MATVGVKGLNSKLNNNNSGEAVSSTYHSGLAYLHISQDDSDLA